MERTKREQLDKNILETTGQWKVPFDKDQAARAKNVVMDAVLRSNNTNAAEPVVNAPHSYSYLQMAAVIAVIIGIPFLLYFLGNTEVSNVSNEPIAHKLPCGSQLQLGPNSKISYNRIIWTVNRTLHLSGEGFFDVVKGNDFVVETDGPSVKALGTKFSVWMGNNNFFVFCSEGIVEVDEEVQHQLSAGDYLQIKNNQLVASGIHSGKGLILPRRSTDVLTFDDVPVGMVIAELESVLNVDINSTLPSQLSYSGALDISDINACFEVFCKPFAAEYKLDQYGNATISP